MIIKKYFFKILISSLFFSLINSTTFAQQTIINVPSSEVLPAGDILLKDSNKFSPIEDGYAGITPSATVGLGKGFELSNGINANLDKETIIKNDLSAKKVWFLGASNRITVGGTISPYLNSDLRPNSFIYSHATHRIKKTKTSITAGIYAYGKNSKPDDFGALIGVEQVIIPNKLRFAMDWLSTPDSFGKMGVGIKYRPKSTISITSAVIIPNDDEENIAFNLSISKFISFNEKSILNWRLKNVD